MRNRRTDFISTLKWPALAAALVAGGFAWLSTQNTVPATAPADRPAETVSRVEMRDAMRLLRDGHDRALDQAARQRAESEQKAAEDAHAFEQARIAAAQEAARVAAAEEAARKLAEQRAAEMKRVADAASKEARKPKPEPAAAAAPLEIVPASGQNVPPVQKPRGPIDTVVAAVGDVADGIVNKTVSTVTGIKDWFSAAGDKLLGREKQRPSSVPASRLSSSW